MLLKYGADVSITGNENLQAIHEACSFPGNKSNSFEMLKLLMAYGADVNAVQKKYENPISPYTFVPLQGAIDDFSCAKLLIDNNANIYYKTREDFRIWLLMFIDDLNDGILVAKYLIVDKRVKIPDPIFHTAPDNKPRDIYYLLKKNAKFEAGSKKEIAKNEIVQYLKSINYPNDTSKLYIQ